MNFMKERGINVRLITGDNIENASSLATKCNIDNFAVFSDMQYRETKDGLESF